MPLFTVLVEVEGGTDLAQFDTPDHVAAIGAWCERTRGQKTVGPHSWRLAKAVERSLRGGATLVPLDGLRNVWCHVALYAGRLVLVNVVGTTPAQEGDWPPACPRVPTPA